MKDLIKSIKPCPFCGEQVVPEEDSDSGAVLYIHPESDCILGGFHIPALPEYVRGWDARPIEDVLSARAEAAEAASMRLIAVLKELLGAFHPDVFRMLAGHPACDMEKAEEAVIHARETIGK